MLAMLQRINYTLGARVERACRVFDDSRQRIDTFPVPMTSTVLVDVTRRALRWQEKLRLGQVH